MSDQETRRSRLLALRSLLNNALQIADDLDETALAAHINHACECAAERIIAAA